MTEQNPEDNSEILLEWVDKGISLQRDGKHKEAIVCFDKAIRGSLIQICCFLKIIR